MIGWTVVYHNLGGIKVVPREMLPKFLQVGHGKDHAAWFEIAFKYRASSVYAEDRRFHGVWAEDMHQSTTVAGLTGIFDKDDERAMTIFRPGSVVASMHCPCLTQTCNGGRIDWFT